MGDIDIERMISDIISAQNSPSAQWYRRDLAKENETALNNEDYRKRRLLEMGEAASTARTGMTVAGNADVENIRSRARLELGKLEGQQGMELGQQTGEFGIRGHEIMAGAQRYGSDVTADTERYKADMAKEKIIGGTPEEQNLLNTRGVMNSPWAKDRTPEEVSAMIAKVNTKPPQEVGKHDDNKDILSPTAYHPPVLSVSAPPPVRVALTTPKSILPPTNDGPGLPQAAIGLANWFSPEEWAKRRKKLYEE